MSTQPSMFKTPAGQAKYFTAYETTLSLWPVPVESFDVPTQFGPTRVNACGSPTSPPLVLVPGQAISSTMWYPNVATLSREYRIYAPDIVGDLGKSVCIKPKLSALDYGDWLRDVFTELGLNKAHLAGMSFGGFIVLRLALSAPELVDKLILMAPASLLPLRFTFFMRMVTGFLPNFILPLESKQKLLFGHASPNGLPLLKQLLTPTDFRYNMFLPPVYTDQELQQLNPPTLLLLGQQEVIYNIKTALKRAHLIPNIETKIIPNAGHTLNCDQPELVNQHILTFLKQQPNSIETTLP